MNTITLIALLSIIIANCVTIYFNNKTINYTRKTNKLLKQMIEGAENEVKSYKENSQNAR